MLVFATPNWQWRTPIAITGECPIDIVIEPIAVTALFYGRWMPIGCRIFAKQCILN